MSLNACELHGKYYIHSFIIMGKILLRRRDPNDMKIEGSVLTKRRGSFDEIIANDFTDEEVKEIGKNFKPFHETMNISRELDPIVMDPIGYGILAEKIMHLCICYHSNNHDREIESQFNKFLKAITKEARLHRDTYLETTGQNDNEQKIIDFNEFYEFWARDMILNGIIRGNKAYQFFFCLDLVLCLLLVFLKRDSPLLVEIKNFETLLNRKGYILDKCTIDFDFKKIDFDVDIQDAQQHGSPQQVGFLNSLKTATEEIKKKVQTTMSTESFEISENPTNRITILKKDLLYQFSSPNFNKYLCHSLMLRFIFIKSYIN